METNFYIKSSQKSGNESFQEVNNSININNINIHYNIIYLLTCNKPKVHLQVYI